MAAMYRVNFTDGVSLIVYSADAKTTKTRDVRAAYTKARRKAQAKRKRDGLLRGAVTAVNCVG